MVRLFDMSILEDDGEESKESDKDSDKDSDSDSEEKPSRKRKEKPVPAKNLKRKKVETKKNTGFFDDL